MEGLTFKQKRIWFKAYKKTFNYAFKKLFRSIKKLKIVLWEERIYLLKGIIFATFISSIFYIILEIIR